MIIEQTPTAWTRTREDVMREALDRQIGGAGWIVYPEPGKEWKVHPANFYAVVTGARNLANSIGPGGAYWFTMEEIEAAVRQRGYAPSWESGPSYYPPAPIPEPLPAGGTPTTPPVTTVVVPISPPVYTPTPTPVYTPTPTPVYTPTPTVGPLPIVPISPPPLRILPVPEPLLEQPGVKWALLAVLAAAALAVGGRAK